MRQTPAQNPTWDELPDSLVPVKWVRLEQYNPIELETIAAHPERIAEMPVGTYPPMLERRIRNLAPYRGHTPEGRRRSLAHLRRNVERSIVPVKPALPPGVPAPNVPTAPVPRSMKQRDILRAMAVLSKEEYELYVETWKAWIETHPDYNQAEDEKDLKTVCMEEALQFRYQLLLGRKPGDEKLFEAYNQSFRRQQQARDNLAARRDLRLGITAKGNGKATTNINGNVSISVLAGAIDEKKIQQLKVESDKRAADDLKRLNEGDNNADLLGIIDAEIVSVRQNPPPQEETTAEESDEEEEESENG